MRLPIQYAMGFPERLKSDFPRFSFLNNNALTFEEPDRETFRNLALAFRAMETGGNMPCVLNAANEVAVEMFLKDGLQFLEMSDLIEECMETIPHIKTPNFEDYVETDEQTRKLAVKVGAG